uniref:Putative RNA-binding protein n=1 Tax=Trypanosoma congolense (strain IL3000) TaxID=1068625 RepID=G0UR13_TRYCI|nr:putative RNA-binding protein [Trypanosoma congolense IL3000]
MSRGQMEVVGMDFACSPVATPCTTSGQAQVHVGNSSASTTSLQLPSPTLSDVSLKQSFKVDVSSTAAGEIAGCCYQGEMERDTAAAVVSPCSSTATGAPLATTSVRGGSIPGKSTLNPEAKEFQIPVENIAFPSPVTPIPMDVQQIFQSPFLYCPTAPVSSVALPWPPTRGGVPNEVPFTPLSKDGAAAKWPVASTPTVRVMATLDGGNASNTAATTSSQCSTPLTPESLTTQITAHFAEECKNNNSHLVVVFNLEPRTTREELLNIFFPMNAKRAEILPQHFSLRPTRRAGAVFFPSQAFALVAVEKFNDFVPNGQHQPLRVICCSRSAPSDETAKKQKAVPPASTKGSEAENAKERQHQQQIWVRASTTKPWRLPPGTELDKTHLEMCHFVQKFVMSSANRMRHAVAVHGLDPELSQTVITRNFIQRGAERFDTWPPKSCAFPTTPMSCSSVSALVYYAEESLAEEAVALFQLKPPDGQTQPIDVVHLNKLFGFRPSSLTTTSKHLDCTLVEGTRPPVTFTGEEESFDVKAFDQVDEFFKRTNSGHNLHHVSVHNLSPMLDKRSLSVLFSRYKALDYEMYPDFVQFSGGKRRSCLIFFDEENTAREAATKLSSFYSAEQPFPIISRYLSGPKDTDKKESTCCTDSGVSGTRTQPSQMITNSGVNELWADVGSNAFLKNIVEQLHATVVDPEALTESMLRLLVAPETTEEVAEKLAAVLTGTLTGSGHHAQTLSTPLVHALLSLHDRLGVPRRGGRDASGLENGDEQDPNVKRNIIYVSTIARSLINLFMDNEKPDEPRKVAAVLSAYLFQYCYLKKSPYELAVKIIKENEQQLRSAREHERNCPLVTKPSLSLDCGRGEEEVHKPWLIMLACLEELTSLWRKNNKSRAKKDPYRKEYDHCVEELLLRDPAQLGGCASLSASARPTPRRVIAKVTPGSSAVTVVSSPGLTMASPSSLRLGTRGGATDITMSSQDVSMECASPPLMTPLSLHCNDMSTPSNVFRHPSGSATAAGIITSRQQQMFLSQQLQVPVQIRQQQQRSMQVRPQLSEAATGMEPTKVMSGQRVSGYTPSVYTQADLMERTVYITKLPSTLRRAQFRRLLTHFGELNKVRLCRDENQVPIKNDINDAGNNGNGNDGVSKPTTMWFSFVEFADPSSSKAIVEYFRNSIFNPSPFSFLLENPGKAHEASSFTLQDIQALMHVRTSPARNPIHDQLHLDAVLTYTFPPQVSVVRAVPCRFGIEHGEKTIDSAIDVSPFSTLGSSTQASSATNAQAGRHHGSLPPTSLRVRPPPNYRIDVPQQQLPGVPTAVRTADGDASDDDSVIEDIMDKGVALSAQRINTKEHPEVMRGLGIGAQSFDSLLKEMRDKSKDISVQGTPPFNGVSQVIFSDTPTVGERDTANFTWTWDEQTFGGALTEEPSR